MAQAEQSLATIQKLLALLKKQSANPTTNDDAGAEAKARLKAIVPRIKKMSGSPLTKQARSTATDAGELIRSQEYSQANAKLDEVERLLDEADQSASATQQDPYEPQYTAILETIPDQMDQLRAVNDAAADKVQKVVDGAAGFANKGNRVVEQNGTAKAKTTKKYAAALGGALLNSNGQVDLPLIHDSVRTLRCTARS